MNEEKTFYIELGKKIAEARRRSRITQQELGRLVGLSRTSVTNIEKGRQPVLVHMLVRISEALNINAVTLLSASKPQNEQPKGVSKSLNKYNKSVQQWVNSIMTSQQGDN